jgi:hypothetical protein
VILGFHVRLKMQLAYSDIVNFKLTRCNGSTTVQCAVMIGHCKVLKLLIRVGADINAPPWPLKGAVKRGRMDMVSYLLNWGQTKELRGKLT